MDEWDVSTAVTDSAVTDSEVTGCSPSSKFKAGLKFTSDFCEQES